MSSAAPPRARVVSPKKRGGKPIVSYRMRVMSMASDDDWSRSQQSSMAAAPVVDDSYREGQVPGLDSSRTGLNKRLASAAGLVDADSCSRPKFSSKDFPQDAPTDLPSNFEFLCGSASPLSRPKPATGSIGELLQVNDAELTELPPMSLEASSVGSPCRSIMDSIEREASPKDFKFLFQSSQDLSQCNGIASVPPLPHAAISAESPVGRSIVASLTASTSAFTNQKLGLVKEDQAPLFFVDGGVQWARTDIKKGADLVDGEGWITDFQQRLVAAELEAAPCPSGGNRSGSSFAARNKILREMASAPGKKVKLPNGEEVIFWFNIGPRGPPRSRVYVTGARCPHQGVCLLESELIDIEDSAGCSVASTRCPRHNKTFDTKTGGRAGNSETLRTYPCRFEYGYWYVGVGSPCEAKHMAEAVPGTPPSALPSPREAETVHRHEKRLRKPRTLAMPVCIVRETETKKPRLRDAMMR